MSKILIVEDDQDIANLERDYLEASGFQVDWLPTGTDLIHTLKTTPYNLVLLDIMLPGVDGLTLCQQIREFDDLPIILVTAKDQAEDIIAGLGLGSDDYITKPFDPAVLVARVRASIASFNRHHHLGEELNVRGLKILPTTRQAFLHSAPLKLTSKEFDLLYFLASHPAQVFSKEDLFEEIWGLDSLAQESTVTVHVNRLREKLAEPFIEDKLAEPAIEAKLSGPSARAKLPEPFIETVWGTGYRFNG